MPDHVHMCIVIPPKHPVASVIGFLKGVAGTVCQFLLHGIWYRETSLRLVDSTSVIQLMNITTWWPIGTDLRVLALMP